MIYVDNNDILNLVLPRVHQDTDHILSPIIASETWKHPTSVVWSMEESETRKVLNNSNKKVGNSQEGEHIFQFARINSAIRYVTRLIKHNKIVQLLPKFKGMPCFKIAHHPYCVSLYYIFFRNGWKTFQSRMDDAFGLGLKFLNDQNWIIQYMGRPHIAEFANIAKKPTQFHDFWGFYNKLLWVRHEWRHISI